MERAPNNNEAVEQKSPNEIYQKLGGLANINSSTGSNNQELLVQGINIGDYDNLESQLDEMKSGDYEESEQFDDFLVARTISKMVKFVDGLNCNDAAPGEIYLKEHLEGSIREKLKDDWVFEKMASCAFGDGAYYDDGEEKYETVELYDAQEALKRFVEPERTFEYAKNNEMINRDLLFSLPDQFVLSHKEDFLARGLSNEFYERQYHNELSSLGVGHLVIGSPNGNFNMWFIDKDNYGRINLPYIFTDGVVTDDSRFEGNFYDPEIECGPASGEVVFSVENASWTLTKEVRKESRWPREIRETILYTEDPESSFKKMHKYLEEHNDRSFSDEYCRPDSYDGGASGISIVESAREEKLNKFAAPNVSN